MQPGHRMNILPKCALWHTPWDHIPGHKAKLNKGKNFNSYKMFSDKSVINLKSVTKQLKKKKTGPQVWKLNTPQGNPWVDKDISRAKRK